jgi:hypothetical protein
MMIAMRMAKGLTQINGAAQMTLAGRTERLRGVQGK